MGQISGVRVRIALVLTVILLLIPSVPKPVLAAQPIDECKPNLDIGKKVPVLYVHGFWGYGGEWLVGNPSLHTVISGIGGVYADGKLDAFDYKPENTHWVDDVNIGPALAMKIACLAESSRLGGGAGKVIVVAYSMGGLATRYAAHVVLPDGHKVADDIGLVITIGTPNTGAVLADFASSILRPLCTFGVINFNGQQLYRDSVTCDQVLPAMWAMETNLVSHVNSLPKFPKSIPVMAIAGNVATTIPLLFVTLPILETDLVVGVDSALAEANDPVHGGGAYVTPLCSANTPIVTKSGADCEHTALLVNKYVQQAVVQSINRYLDFLHPPCPIIAGTCVGIKSGDMDNDGVPDVVGVTWLPNICANGTPSSCRIGVRIILDNGDVIDSNIPWSSEYGYNVTSVQFMGLSDVNGDGRDEVFLELNGDCGYCSTLLVYELHQGSLQLLTFPGTQTPGSGLALGGTDFGNGFTCRVVNGQHQVLAVSWNLGSNTVDERLYQANSDGTMTLIKHDTAIYTAQQESAALGAHCPGLSVF